MTPYLELSFFSSDFQFHFQYFSLFKQTSKEPDAHRTWVKANPLRSKGHFQTILNPSEYEIYSRGRPFSKP